MMTYFRNFSLILIFVVFLSAPQSAPESGGYHYVVAEGVAAMSLDKPLDKIYDEALKDAKRNAVQSGLGVLVDNETLVENYRLISDRILTLSTGYVRNFEVIEKGRDGDLYRVVISAEVAIADMNSDLRAVLSLKAEKNYPRLMLIGMEKAGEEVKSSFTAQAVMEEFLVDKGFDLVDESQVEEIKARDVALNQNDFQKAAALGERFGAEIVVLYQAVADFEGTHMTYGTAMDMYRATVDARIIYADTAALLGSVSAWEHAAAEAGPSAVRLGFKKAAKKAAPLIMDKILADWQKHVHKLELVVSGVDYRVMKQMKDEMENLRWVQGIGSSRLEKETAIFQIQADMSSEEIADALLSNRQLPPLSITSLSPGRIEAKLKDLEK